MADFTTTHFTSSFTCPLRSLQPQVACKHITHFLPSHQHVSKGSSPTHFERKHTSARPRAHPKIFSVNLIVSGLAAPDSQVLHEESKAENSMEAAESGIGGSHDSGGGGGKEDDELRSILAKQGLFSGLLVSKAPMSTTETLYTGHADKLSRPAHGLSDAISTPSTSSDMLIQAQRERVLRKKAQQLTYLFAAVASSVGITSLAGASVYCRFAWQMQGEVPWTEMCGTFFLALGAAVGMEYWARWAHRALWHASLWSMHESHHQPRDGPFELNDVFAIINAVPAIALMAFGFLNKGLVPGLCFGAGVGITMFGIAYMFVHDGLVHRRFPVGPIADVPYFQKVAAAHQLHHADKFNGVPYGLFLGPMEVEEVGGQTELEKLVQKRKRENKNPINS